MSEWGEYLERVIARAEEMDPDIVQGAELLSSNILSYSEESVGMVLGLLINRRLQEVRELEYSRPVSRGLREDLIVFEVRGQNGNARWILVYDSDELWQDPWVFAIL